MSCLLTSCKNSEEKTVVIDGWWDVDFAKGTCVVAQKELDSDKKKKYESFPKTTQIADAAF